MRVLVLDDDELTLQAIRSAAPADADLVGFTDPNAANVFLEKHAVDVVVLDLNLPATSGEQMLRSWKRKFSDPEFVFCSADRDIARAIACLREGASDFLVKPFSDEELKIFLQRAFEKRRLRQSEEKLRPLVEPSPVTFIGNSPSIRHLLEKVARVKHQTHLNILLLGESGTGKEMLARWLHQQENNPKRPFIVANMPAIPAALMEAELFGVERGAFTDAKVTRPGKIELADGGDLFLDEIGDLATETQPKILRALQEKQIERVGSNRTRSFSFRSISATNRPLLELVAHGKFREDLLYRLADVVFQLPPLRHRREDIADLIGHFVGKYSPHRERTFSARALKHFQSYDWPGNIRQLESTVKRALIFEDACEIDQVVFEDPWSWSGTTPITSCAEGLYGQRTLYERSQIEEALRRNGGDRQAAMQELRLPRATFYRKLTQFGIGQKKT